MTTSPCVSCGATLPPGNTLDGLCPRCLLAAACDSAELPDNAGLDPGASLGPYEIVSALGQGGMGEVYLAWDTRLCRTVAIKVLAAPLACDPERTRRLEREARILAGLNHPRICAVHDIGCESGLTYIVMEHLDGETLAERLTRGVLPVAQVIRFGVEIAEGLDGAHRHGITHRDLKPANIMITPAGVKVLDFGLASRGPGGRGQTIPPEYSRVGGTLQYMAPEQLDGKSADVRSDVFAFGLVLREMLGDRSDAPPALARIVQRCLRLDPEERWQSLRDVLFELMEIASDHERPVATPIVDTPLWRSPRAVVSAAIVAVLMSLGAGRFVVSALAEHNLAASPAIRFVASLPTRIPDLSGLSDLAFVSPDGRLLVWVCGSGDGKTQLAVQVLATGETTPLADTDGALWPFWSPDSRTIGFFTRGALRTVKAIGGPVETVAKVVNGAGGSWSTRGTILFAPDRGGPLYEVSERGGDPVPVTALDRDRGHRAHLWPSFLADGRRFIYFASSATPAHRGLYLGEVGSTETRWLGTADGAAVWAPPRHLLFTRGGMLVSQAVDPSTMTLEGDPHVLQQRVCGNSGIVPPCFSASTTGVLVYHVARLFRHQFSWFNRAGRQIDIPIEPGSYFSPVLSPDGMRVAVERHDPQTWQLGIWQFDLTRGMLSRVLDNPVPAIGPLWSPDGRTIAFTSNVETRHGIYVLNTESSVPQQLFSGATNILLTDWSTDRKRLLFQQRGDATREDIWVLPLGQSDAPTPVLQSRFSERQARFSPDGRWLAYSSDESGQFEVYVQPFPPTGAKWQISNHGGREPTWRRDGRELFYLSGDRRLMAMPVGLAHGFRVTPAAELFRVPPDAPRENRISYAPTADGQRFLVNVAARDPIRRPLFETEVIVNWTATLHD
jgi:Tol biopolymer transport system component